ncbi:S8 family serine peptidase [Opitutus sp. GAS368]|uniref:S8 family serine peptidase n=1 Tax=Opitutus sp. GAS368 TaxID=1882749 RepID=UPI000879E0A0|nr:S8 family serine peptidase [Opitutus sp. GAS368]SDS42692.1 Subtilase family protein [Opitutus sp. GAS368]
MNTPRLLFLRHAGHARQFAAHLGAGLIALVLVLGAAPARGQGGGNPAAAASYCGDRLLVKPAVGADLALLHGRLGAAKLREFPEIGGLQVVQLPARADVPELVAAYQRSGLVEYAEPDFIVHALLTPNDFRYWDGSLWNLHNTGIYGGTPGADIHAPQGWDVQHTAPNIIVADVDTGVRLTHEDIAPNLWTNPAPTIGDVHGINAITGTGDPSDDYGHGTHVAGIFGAVGNNAVGVVGVAWQVQIMACKFIDATGNGSISDAITCLDYARAHGAKIVNASWGGYGFASAALFDAIDSLRHAGILLVAACGNDNNDNDTNPLYPASYALDNIIAVAATDRTDNRAWFSNYGARTVQLGAPGSPVFSCWNGSDSDYRYDDGTSMAAPHVSGACALVWAHFPAETYLSIRNRVLANTDPLPSLAGRTVSGGRLDLYQALTHAPPAVNLPTVTVTAPVAAASESGPTPGVFRISRSGGTANPLTVYYMLTGTAQNGVDYRTLPGAVTIPKGYGSATVTVMPVDAQPNDGAKTVILTLAANAAYTVGRADRATVTIADNTTAPSLP